MRYFEVEFYKLQHPDDTYSICILGEYWPSIEETEIFCAKDIEKTGYDGVSSVTEITEWEAHEYFDMENEVKLPVFGKDDD